MSSRHSALDKPTDRKGIIGAKYPKLDMISFGPTIHGAHAPGERVDIASVGQCWDLLQALLRELAR